MVNPLDGSSSKIPDLQSEISGLEKKLNITSQPGSQEGRIRSIVTKWTNQKEKDLETLSDIQKVIKLDEDRVKLLDGSSNPIWRIFKKGLNLLGDFFGWHYGRTSSFWRSAASLAIIQELPDTLSTICFISGPSTKEDLKEPLEKLERMSPAIQKEVQELRQADLERESIRGEISKVRREISIEAKRIAWNILVYEGITPTEEQTQKLADELEGNIFNGVDPVPKAAELSKKARRLVTYIVKECILPPEDSPPVSPEEEAEQIEKLVPKLLENLLNGVEPILEEIESIHKGRLSTIVKQEIVKLKGFGPLATAIALLPKDSPFTMPRQIETLEKLTKQLNEVNGRLLNSSVNINREIYSLPRKTGSEVTHLRTINTARQACENLLKDLPRLEKLSPKDRETDSAWVSFKEKVNGIVGKDDVAKNDFQMHLIRVVSRGALYLRSLPKDYNPEKSTIEQAQGRITLIGQVNLFLSTLPDGNNVEALVESLQEELPEALSTLCFDPDALTNEALKTTLEELELISPTIQKEVEKLRLESELREETTVELSEQAKKIASGILDKLGEKGEIKELTSELIENVLDGVDPVSKAAELTIKARGIVRDIVAESNIPFGERAAKIEELVPKFLENLLNGKDPVLEELELVPKDYRDKVMEPRINRLQDFGPLAAAIALVPKDYLSTTVNPRIERLKDPIQQLEKINTRLLASSGTINREFYSLLRSGGTEIILPDTINAIRRQYEGLLIDLNQLEKIPTKEGREKDPVYISFKARIQAISKMGGSPKSNFAKRLGNAVDSISLYLEELPENYNSEKPTMRQARDRKIAIGQVGLFLSTLSPKKFSSAQEKRVIEKAWNVLDKMCFSSESLSSAELMCLKDFKDIRPPEIRQKVLEMQRLSTERKENEAQLQGTEKELGRLRGMEASGELSQKISQKNQELQTLRLKEKQISDKLLDCRVEINFEPLEGEEDVNRTMFKELQGVFFTLRDKFPEINSKDLEKLNAIIQKTESTPKFQKTLREIAGVLQFYINSHEKNKLEGTALIQAKAVIEKTINLFFSFAKEASPSTEAPAGKVGMGEVSKSEIQTAVPDQGLPQLMNLLDKLCLSPEALSEDELWELDLGKNSKPDQHRINQEMRQLQNLSQQRKKTGALVLEKAKEVTKDLGQEFGFSSERQKKAIDQILTEKEPLLDELRKQKGPDDPVVKKALNKIQELQNLISAEEKLEGQLFEQRRKVNKLCEIPNEVIDQDIVKKPNEVFTEFLREFPQFGSKFLSTDEPLTLSLKEDLDQDWKEWDVIPVSKGDVNKTVSSMIEYLDHQYGIKLTGMELIRARGALRREIELLLSTLPPSEKAKPKAVPFKEGPQSNTLQDSLQELKAEIFEAHRKIEREYGPLVLRESRTSLPNILLNICCLSKDPSIEELKLLQGIKDWIPEVKEEVQTFQVLIDAKKENKAQSLKKAEEIARNIVSSRQFDYPSRKKTEFENIVSTLLTKLPSEQETVLAEIPENFHAAVKDLVKLIEEGQTIEEKLVLTGVEINLKIHPLLIKANEEIGIRSEIIKEVNEKFGELFMKIAHADSEKIEISEDLEPLFERLGEIGTDRTLPGPFRTSCENLKMDLRNHIEVPPTKEGVLLTGEELLRERKILMARIDLFLSGLHPPIE